MTESDVFDLIVVGSGISGCLAALNVQKKGQRVLILEASSRNGGQILSSSFSGLETIFEKGAEFLDPRCHSCLYELLQKYGLEVSQFKHPNELWKFANDSILPDDKLTAAVQSSAEYSRIVALMNFHAGKVKFSRGYDQPEISWLDITIADYVEQQLLINARNHPQLFEYLMTEIFLITGGLPESQSALSLLYLIAGFGGVEKIFHLNRKLYRVNRGMSALIEKVLDEFESLGGMIRYNQPVIEVTSVPKPEVAKASRCSGVLPVYDYPEGSETDRLVRLKASSGQLHLCRGAVVAVPLSCLSSIRFSPPLPDSLRDAAERCQAGVQLVKLWGRAVSVSPRIYRTLTYCHPCKDVKHVVYQQEEEQQGLLVTLDARGDPLDVDEQLFGVWISGWRRDLLTLTGDSANSSGGSNGCAIASSDPRAAPVPSPSLMRTLHPKAEFVQTVGATIHFHDFSRDPYSHGSWFCLRAGTAVLHARAVSEAVQPWTSANGSLTLACSDLSPEWTGWVEGAVLSGVRAAQRMVTYLIPEKIPRNFLKRVPPPSADNKSRK